MSLSSPLHTTADVCACVEMFPRHPRYVRRFKRRAAIYFGRRPDRRVKESTLKGFSMIIGAPTSASSPYQVRRDHQLVRFWLIRTTEVIVVGKYRWSLEVQFSVPTTVCLFAAAHPGQPITICAGGISTLVAPRPRKLVKGILPIDERIDGKGCGDSY